MKTQNKYTIYAEHTDNDISMFLIEMLKGFDWIEGYTVYEGRGYWHGESNPVFILDIISEDNIYTELVGFCETIKTVSGTDSVLLTWEIIKTELI